MQGSAEEPKAKIGAAWREAAFIFIFATVLLDMLAIGIVIPVLPKLVVDFVGGDTQEAAKIFGVFGTAWALMQFLFSPLQGALSDSFGAAHDDIDLQFRCRARLCADGARADARLAVCGPGDLRRRGGKHFDLLRVCR
jgi:MFS family permease